MSLELFLEAWLAPQIRPVLPGGVWQTHNAKIGGMAALHVHLSVGLVAAAWLL